MLEISRAQIEAVRKDAFLGPKTQTMLVSPEITSKASEDLSEEEWDDLNDACLNVLTNDAPVVESFDAEQSKGVYTVSICGIPGAYFLTAPEFDDAGVFSELRQARDEADYQHGEFRVRDEVDDDEEDDEEDDDWCEPDPKEPTFPDSLIRILAGTDEEVAVAVVRRQVLADDDLIMLANGSRWPDSIPASPDVADFVAAFEETLPRPRGFIDGMARQMNELRRLQLRVELFVRINGRLPSLGEAARIYDMD